MNFEQIVKEVQIVAVRSRGPGGQNVNKVSSAAQLFWNIRESSAVTLLEVFLIESKLPNIINSEHQIYLRSDEFRDLEQNKSRCIEKLRAFLATALHKPKKRKPTKPTKSSKKKRLESKSQHGETKRQRSKVRY